MRPEQHASPGSRPQRDDRSTALGSLPRCARCGYILYQAPEPRCPECGTAFSPEDLTLFQGRLAARDAHRRERRNTALAAAGLILGLVLVLWRIPADPFSGLELFLGTLVSAIVLLWGYSAVGDARQAWYLLAVLWFLLGIIGFRWL